MSTRELSDAEKAEKKDKYMAERSPKIIITQPHGKWKAGDRPTVLQWKADELVKLGVAKYEGFLSRTINKIKNG